MNGDDVRSPQQALETRAVRDVELLLDFRRELRPVVVLDFEVKDCCFSGDMLLILSLRRAKFRSNQRTYLPNSS